jgi:hypothetical protein
MTDLLCWALPWKTRKLKKPFYTMEPIVHSQEIRIQSSFEELGSIVINNSDIEKWPGESVLCHNDPTPRNVILQSHASSGGKSKYNNASFSTMSPNSDHCLQMPSQLEKRDSHLLLEVVKGGLTSTGQPRANSRNEVVREATGSSAAQDIPARTSHSLSKGEGNPSQIVSPFATQLRSEEHQCGRFKHESPWKMYARGYELPLFHPTICVAAIIVQSSFSTLPSH